MINGHSTGLQKGALQICRQYKQWMYPPYHSPYHCPFVGDVSIMKTGAELHKLHHLGDIKPDVTSTSDSETKDIGC